MSGIVGLPLYEILDERFKTGRCANGDMRLDRLYDDCHWAEGPLYLPAWRQLVWSDIPNDRVLRWDEATGAVSVFRSRAGHSNGNTLDREGNLITCEQGNRRVTRTEPDGRITVLADRFDGKRLNSPNDTVVRSDGSVWLSDPNFGITSNYCYAADGALIGRVRVPEPVSNIAFGGPKNNRLFITATTSLLPGDVRDRPARVL